MIYHHSFETPLGKMMATANDNALLSLIFCDDEQPSLPSSSHTITPPLRAIQQEVTLYFQGNLTEFSTPLDVQGTSFQQRVWSALQAIPYGTTCSYSALAETVGNPRARRAVAKANSMNSFTLIIPCHRVIQLDSGLGGYACGIERKRWLLDHEKAMKS